MRFTLSDFASLLPYGWSNQPLPPDTEPARVTRHDGASLAVIAADGPRVIRNSAQLDPDPTVGDWLALDADGRIHSVLPRHSLLRRENADATGVQSLAANVDVVLIACGIDRPIKPGRVYRAIALARDAGADPVLVLTKAGAADAPAPDVPRLEREHPGVPVLVTSALEGVGLDAVRAAIAGRTAVLLGESGAGKSTLVNALLGRADAATGAVRAGDAKGRHTTTSRQLHLLPADAGGGVIIDTPGIRGIGLFTDADAVDAAFADIADLAASCRFADCGHATEPGCAVLAAIADGTLSAERHAAWRRLQREVASAARRAEPHTWRSRELGRAVKKSGRAAKEGQARKRR